MCCHTSLFNCFNLINYLETHWTGFFHVPYYWPPKGFSDFSIQNIFLVKVKICKHFHWCELSKTIWYIEKHCFDLSVFLMIISFLIPENQTLQWSDGNLFGTSESLSDSVLWHYWDRKSLGLCVWVRSRRSSRPVHKEGKVTFTHRWCLLAEFALYGL